MVTAESNKTLEQLALNYDSQSPPGLCDNEMAVAMGEAGPSRQVLSRIRSVRMSQETVRI